LIFEQAPSRPNGPANTRASLTTNSEQYPVKYGLNAIEVTNKTRVSDTILHPAKFKKFNLMISIEHPSITFENAPDKIRFPAMHNI